MAQKTKQILGNYIRPIKGTTTEHLNRETTEPSPHLDENLYISQ